MNYEANTIQWRRGDIVIHDEDAKEPDMLMRIVGFTRKDNLAKCQYVAKRHPRKLYINDYKYLHDPNRFGLNPEWGKYSQETLKRIQRESDRVRIWNSRFRLGLVGLPVKTTSADGGFETVTIGKAYLDKGGQAMITLERGGNWSLMFVEPVLTPIGK